MHTNQRLEKLACHQIQTILTTPPTITLEGEKVPNYHTEPNIQNLRIIQTDLVYLFGMPVELCDATVSPDSLFS